MLGAHTRALGERARRGLFVRGPIASGQAPTPSIIIIIIFLSVAHGLKRLSMARSKEGKALHGACTRHWLSVVWPIGCRTRGRRVASTMVGFFIVLYFLVPCIGSGFVEVAALSCSRAVQAVTKSLACACCAVPHCLRPRRLQRQLC